MTTRTVRRAGEPDVPALTQMRNDAHAKKLDYFDYAWGKEGDGFSERWVLNHVVQKNVYVVEQDGVPAGTFSLDLEDEQHWGPQEPVAGYVHGLCVRKTFNGLGLGSFMLDWCANEVSGLNRRYVRLDCAAQNQKLCAYYESLGFIRVGLKADRNVWSLYEKPVQ